jgi:hypothetical protein
MGEDSNKKGGRGENLAFETGLDPSKFMPIYRAI